MSVGGNGGKVNYVNFFYPEKEKLEGKSKVVIDYTPELENHPELSGALSTLLSSSYQFSLKTLDLPK